MSYLTWHVTSLRIKNSKPVMNAFEDVQTAKKPLAPKAAVTRISQIEHANQDVERLVHPEGLQGL